MKSLQKYLLWTFIIILALEVLTSPILSLLITKNILTSTITLNYISLVVSIIIILFILALFVLSILELRKKGNKAFSIAMLIFSSVYIIQVAISLFYTFVLG
jgi:hypothetical protein